MKLPLLSIIVPIFNVEQFLPRCLDSILAQEFTDYELILVNDGSPDRCDEIMNKYADRDLRITTIYQNNQGVSSARNAGLKVAQGKYVGFVDPDDWISPFMYSTVITAMEENSNFDIGIVGFKREINLENQIDDKPMYLNEKCINQIQLASELFHVPLTIGGYVWNKVFRLDKISSMFDPQQSMCEDMMFVLKYLENCEYGILINIPLYHMYLRNGSVSRSNPRNYLEALRVKKQICLHLKDSPLSEVYSVAFNDYFDTCIRVLHMQNKTEDRKNVRRIIFKEMGEMLLNPKFTVLKKNEVFICYSNEIA